MNPSNLLRKIIKNRVSKKFGSYRLDIPNNFKKIFIKESDVGDELDIFGKRLIITNICDGEIYVINKTLRFLVRGKRFNQWNSPPY